MAGEITMNGCHSGKDGFRMWNVQRKRIGRNQMTNETCTPVASRTDMLRFTILMYSWKYTFMHT